MNCNDTNVKYFVTSIVNNGTQVVLTFNNIPNITDRGFFRFRFSQNLSLPSGYSALPVVASVNVNGTTTLIKLYDKFAEEFKGNEIILNSNGGVCTRYVYRAYTGIVTNVAHILTSNVPKIQNHNN